MTDEQLVRLEKAFNEVVNALERIGEELGTLTTLIEEMTYDKSPYADAGIKRVLRVGE